MTVLIKVLRNSNSIWICHKDNRFSNRASISASCELIPQGSIIKNQERCKSCGTFSFFIQEFTDTLIPGGRMLRGSRGWVSCCRLWDNVQKNPAHCSKESLDISAMTVKKNRKWFWQLYCHLIKKKKCCRKLKICYCFL